jgi:nicotinamidase-related amidase
LSQNVSQKESQSLNPPGAAPAPIVPGEYVHVVIDVQRGFCDPSYVYTPWLKWLLRPFQRGSIEADRIAGRIASFTDEFRRAGFPTYLVYYRGNVHLHPDKANGGFHKVRPEPGDILVGKSRDSAFHQRGLEVVDRDRRVRDLEVLDFPLHDEELKAKASSRQKGWLDKIEAAAYSTESDLDTILRQSQVKGLIVSGFNLSACVNITVADALRRGYEVIVLTDGVGNDRLPRPKWLEKAMVKKMQELGVRFLSSSEVLAAVKQGEPRVSAQRILNAKM